MVENRVTTYQTELFKPDLYKVLAQTTPDNTVRVDVGHIRMLDGSYWEGTIGTTAAFLGLFALRYRWDWLCLNLSSGSPIVEIIPGEEHSFPITWWHSRPEIPPCCLPIAVIMIDSSSPIIRQDSIVDVRSFVPNMNNFIWKVLSPGNLNDLLSEMESGDKYFLLPGSYEITSTLTLLDNVHIVGSGCSGASSTIIELDMSGGYGIELSDGCFISGLYIDGLLNNVGGIYASSVSDYHISDTSVVSMLSVDYAAMLFNESTNFTLKNIYAARDAATATSEYVIKINKCSRVHSSNVHIVLPGIGTNDGVLYIGGDSVTQTSDSVFDSYFIEFEGLDAPPVFIEYCTSCRFTGLMATNNGFNNTTFDRVYDIQNMYACFFSCAISDVYRSGTGDLNGIFISDSTSSFFDILISSDSLDYGLKLISSGAAASMCGVRSITNTCCTFHVKIEGSGDSGMYSNLSSISADNKYVFGVTLLSDYAGHYLVNISGIADFPNAGFGIQDISAYAANKKIYGVYTSFCRGTKIDSTIMGKGGGSCGISSIECITDGHNIGFVSSTQASYATSLDYKIVGGSSGFGIKAIQVIGASCISCHVRGLIVGSLGGGGISCSTGTAVGLATSLSSVYLYLGYLAIASDDESVTGIKSTGSNMNTISCFYKSDALKSSGAAKYAYGIDSAEDTVCNCVMLSGAITADTAYGIFADTNGCIRGNSIALPTATGGGTAWSIYRNSAASNTCIVGNNCGGVAGVNKYIRFGTGAGAVDSHIGNIPNNTD